MNAAWFNFTKRGQAWDHFWQDAPEAHSGAGAEDAAFVAAAVGQKGGVAVGSDAVSFSESASGEIQGRGQGSAASAFAEVATGSKQGFGVGSATVLFSESSGEVHTGAGLLDLTFGEAATGAQGVRPPRPSRSSAGQSAYITRRKPVRRSGDGILALRFYLSATGVASHPLPSRRPDPIEELLLVGAL